MEFGTHHGIAWEQFDFPRFLKTHNMKSINLCNTVPLLTPKGISVIHDVSYRANPQFFRGFRGLLRRLWHRVHYKIICAYSSEIITVSAFSKSEIMKHYRVDASRITVAGNGWQHMNRVGCDESIFDRFRLKTDNYYFSMSSLGPNKNVAWIMECARKTPDIPFVIAGSSSISEVFLDVPQNVIFPGRVTDAEAKTLMMGCRAFLFPTFYEGFGIPPLEALACGVPIIVANTPCMHEIFGDAASYIDPLRSIALSGLIEIKEDARNATLERYSWEQAANIFATCIQNEEKRS